MTRITLCCSLFLSVFSGAASIPPLTVHASKLQSYHVAHRNLLPNAWCWVVRHQQKIKFSSCVILLGCIGYMWYAVRRAERINARIKRDGSALKSDIENLNARTEETAKQALMHSKECENILEINARLEEQQKINQEEWMEQVKALRQELQAIRSTQKPPE